MGLGLLNASAPADIHNLGIRPGRGPAPGLDPHRLLLQEGKLSPERAWELHRELGTQAATRHIHWPILAATKEEGVESGHLEGHGVGQKLCAQFGQTGRALGS